MGRVTARRVAVAVGLAVVVAACSPISPRAPTPAPTVSIAAVPSLAGVPSPAGVPGPIAEATGSPTFWRLIHPLSVDAADAGTSIATCAECHADVNTTMSGVTAGPAGLVAVGWIFQGYHGLAWHSADGERWVPGEPLPSNTSLTGVAADARRYVAVGFDGKGATAWTSSDGSAWLPAGSSAFAGAPLHVTAVVHWTGGFVAAGFEGSDSGPSKAAFWLSPDGTSWRRAPAAPALDGARVLSLAAGPDRLVAVGAADTTASPMAVAWTSVDGLHWTRAAAGPALAGAGMQAVAAVPGIGFVAAGQDAAASAGLVWSSVDGTSWTRATIDPGPGASGGHVRITALAAGGPGVVAAGAVSFGSDAQYVDAGIWTSRDGHEWLRQPASSEFVAADVSALAPWGAGLLAVGDTGLPDDFAATVWASPPSLRH